MHWSIYDTMILITGIISAVIAILPVAGVPAKTRFSAALTATVLIAAAFYLGGLRSFTYPSFVYAGPLIALLAMGGIVADARKRTREGAEPLQADDRGHSVPQPLALALASSAPPAAVDPGLPEPEASAPELPASSADVPEEDEAAGDELDNALDPVAVSEADDQHRDLAWAAVSDPATQPDQLLAVLTDYPEFGPAALEHPNSYPELRDWIRANTLS